MKKFCTNILGMISLPAITYAFFFVICRMNGSTTFGVGTDLTTMLVTTVYTGFIALAVSYNLTSGRFDFSVGSVLILSNIIGFKIALALGLGPIPLAIITIIAGMILGAISGVLYVTLKLPPMVCSLGVAMLYEAVAFIISDGAGVKAVGRNDILVFAKAPGIVILLAIALIVLIILYNYTPFGYHCKSLQTGQEISVNVGIDENKNSIACYIIAGALMAAAGLINTSRLGTVTPDTGLGSSSYIMNAFLPMFIGTFLARFGDRNIGVIMGALAQSIITSAFGTGKLNFSSNLQTVLNSVIILLFMFVTNNSYRLEEAKIIKRRMEEAKEEQKCQI